MRDSMELNKFSLRDIINQHVTVITKKAQKITGVLVLYGMQDKTIVLKDFSILEQNEDGNWEEVEKGKVIVIKHDGWVMLKI